MGKPCSLQSRVQEAVRAIVDFVKREGPNGWDDPWSKIQQSYGDVLEILHWSTSLMRDSIELSLFQKNKDSRRFLI
ncbi:hypothetical protein GUJ93_ZPchr0043g16395 [Zizania palustris]|uniref:Uncharacterized protein n=1 Tax=Zizania palustris TaxID=103762 RepID=A0A8J5UV59_ZIZPA|nr:hypothetical protein GUJ93_ZPchr0043g16395 [Zizania palustris]